MQHITSLLAQTVVAECRHDRMRRPRPACSAGASLALACATCECHTTALAFQAAACCFLERAHSQAAGLRACLLQVLEECADTRSVAPAACHART